MKYLRIYNKIIERAKNREINGYVEKHHIVPKCIGGNNKKDNIVSLTPKEHYICHRLLCEIYPDETKLKYAFWRMCNVVNNKYQDRNYTVSANVYSRIKTEISKLMSKKVKNYSKETRELIGEKISKKLKCRPTGKKGIPNPTHSEWMKKNNPFKGKTHTTEVKEILGKINSKPKSEEHKRKISETLKGNKPGNMRKVIVDGIEYESLSYAARQVGIPTATMKNRLKSPKFDNYKYKD
jgi:hypothetical protein